MANKSASKGGSKSNGGSANTSAEEKKRRGLSPASRLKLALNDVLDDVKNGSISTESPSFQQASSVLESLGFEMRASSASKLAELQEELKNLDITSPNSQTRLNEISKEMGKLRRV